MLFVPYIECNLCKHSLGLQSGSALERIMSNLIKANAQISIVKYLT